MPRLSLSDPRWLELGTRSALASPVPVVLGHLLSSPEDVEAFQEFWPHLCSEDTAWPAAYAALPYILDVAEALPSGSCEAHLFFAGYVAMCTRGGVVPPALRDEYEAALARALSLYPATFGELSETHSIRHALAAMAALKGQQRLGALIADLDGGCPRCGGGLLEEG